MIGLDFWLSFGCGLLFFSGAYFLISAVIDRLRQPKRPGYLEVTPSRHRIGIDKGRSK